MRLDADLQQLCAILTSDAVPADAGRLFALARVHRVDALLARRLRARDRLRGAAAHALSGEHDLLEICDAAHRHGIDTLLIKGAALAYTHYPEPHLRPRADIDLLVRRRDLPCAEAVLTGCGYARDVEADAELWTGQRHFVKWGAAGPVMVDLHWRAANPLAFSDALAFDDVWPRAVMVPALGRHARTLAPADSLLLACLHRVAHHRDRVELLWLWDIHLLASRLPPEEFARFSERAVRARVAQVCARSLDLARECFGTVIPADTRQTLAAASGEPSAAFLGEGLGPLDVARSDLAALRGWRVRAGLVREHLVPPASYMRQRYPRWPAALLPIAYVHRIVKGAPRWLRR